MQLIPLHTTHALYAEAEQLLLSAFPPEERRPVEQQRKMTDLQPDFRLYAITLNGKFAGLITLWMLDGFRYVEHLATLPELRGNGIGKRVLQQLMESDTLPIVLEVEPPTHEFAVRRIGFYQRCGFIPWEKQTYIQPPYSAELPAIPLILMVHGDIDEEKDFCKVRHEIHSKVYGVSDVFV